MPHSVKSFANVTVDSPDFFARIKSLAERHVSWLTVESPGIKPDCKEESKLLSCWWLYKCLNTNLSNTLLTELSKEIGRKLETIERSPFSGTGQTLVSLYEVGKRPVCRDSLKREHKGGDNSYASSRRMRLLIPSGPDAFPLRSVLRIDSTSSRVRIILCNCDTSTEEGRIGRIASLSSSIV